MKKHIGFVALCFLLTFTSSIYGQTVKLPAEIKGDVGSFVRVAAETDGSQVRWLALDQGLSAFPSDLLKDTKTTVVVAQRPGRYRLAAWTAKGDVPSDAAVTTIVIGDVPPGPPTPPVPPPTPPTPPIPEDPLFLKLQAAYKLETSVTKVEELRKLAALYRQAAVITSDTGLTTWGQLYDVMRSAAATLGVSGKLPNIQQAIGMDLTSSLPTERSKVLDAAGREKAAVKFKHMAMLLEALK